jgi:hypothetical protein
VQETSLVRSSPERWRAAIENYSGEVKPGNQTSLNTAALPFASFLNAMHVKLHPIFADQGLAALDKLPAGHVASDPKLMVRLEVVLDPSTGAIKKMGVVRTSGVTVFDMLALDSFMQAQPFGRAPDAIVSADGNVYIHWDLHRDPALSCATTGASPYMLSSPPK